MNLRRLFAIGLLACTTFVHAELVEGENYLVLPKPIPTLEKNKNKIEVLEIFSYTCSHCRNLDPVLREHAKSFFPDVETRKEHIVWSDPEIVLAKITSTIKQTYTQNRLNASVFKALFDDKINLVDPKELKAWVDKQDGIDSDRFFSVYNSFGTNAEANQMRELTDTYEINSTPRIIIDGKYQVPLIGDFQEVMGTVDQVINKVRKERNMPDPKTLAKVKITSLGILLAQN